MNVSLRALIIEDSADDAALLIRELRRGGYDLESERVDTPAGLLGAFDREWDLVLCDYSMPYFSGTDALKALRSRGLEIPFIFVSGTIGEEAAVAALKQGAQDYVMKGNLRRLVPAIQRELKEVSERRVKTQLERQVRQLERFEAIGRLAGGIAHDFNNVIGAILGWAELGQYKATSDNELHEYFYKILTEAQRAAGLTRQLLTFARRQVLQPEKIDLNSFISEMSNFLQSTLGEAVEFERICEPTLRVISADPTHVGQVVMNLCLNAKDAMLHGGRLIMETQNVEIDEEFCRRQPNARPGNYVTLAISDTGTGMDAATLDGMFEPFFTTKDPGKGTGLGLATVYGIVKQHNGFISVCSKIGEGTTFRVYFPAATGVPSLKGLPTHQGSLSGTEVILVAEDHRALRELVQETLDSRGYRTIAANNGEDAVRLFEENSATIQLVVLDVVMPAMNGPEAYARMITIRPDIPVIFTTGHTAETASLDLMVSAGAVLLQKPYPPHVLSQAVRTTLDRYRSRNSNPRAMESDIGSIGFRTGT